MAQETNEMIKLIVTASDKLYSTLSEKVRAEGDIPQRARDVLQGFRQAAQLGSAQTGQESAMNGLPQGQLSGIIVDMALHAADTLLETLHSRQSTYGIPLLAVRCDGQPLPLTLRRLCTDVLDANGATDESALAKTRSTGEP
jgi:hypothetical protein